MGDDRVIVVAITNGGFPSEVIDGWWETMRVCRGSPRGLSRISSFGSVVTSRSN